MGIFLVIFDALLAGIFTYKAICSNLIGDGFIAGMWFAFFIHSLISLLL